MKLVPGNRSGLQSQLQIIEKNWVKISADQTKFYFNRTLSILIDYERPKKAYENFGDIGVLMSCEN